MRIKESHQLQVEVMFITGWEALPSWQMENIHSMFQITCNFYQATVELQTSPAFASPNTLSSPKPNIIPHTVEKLEWTGFNQNGSLFKSNLYYPRSRTGLIKFICCTVIFHDYIISFNWTHPQVSNAINALKRVTYILHT